MLFRILIFDPNWAFCKGYSACIVTNFSNFRKLVIFRVVGVFLNPFSTPKNSNVLLAQSLPLKQSGYHITQITIFNYIITQVILAVRTSVTYSAAPRVPLFCSYHILTSSVIYYWTDARQHGIYLLIITPLSCTQEKKPIPHLKAERIGLQ